LLLSKAILRRFTPDAETMDRRLKARVSRSEFFALALSLSLVGCFIWVYTQVKVPPNDYGVYLRTVAGDFRDYYYAYWLWPVFWLFEKLPLFVGYAIWSAVSIASVFFAGRVFGGRVALALLSFQMLYVVYLGQIIGIIIGGLALCWWALAHKRWDLAGLGLILASTKIHTGATLGLLLLVLAPITWRQRLRVLLVPAVVVVLSLVVYPRWPLDALENLGTNPANDWGSIALWRWIGPWALLLWAPPLLLRLSPAKRLVALTATMALALPYFQQTDLLALYVLPIGWFPVLLGNLGYLFFSIQWDALQMLFLVPLVVYLSLIIPETYKALRSKWRSASKD
jgi:hypothetical protein